MAAMGVRLMGTSTRAKNCMGPAPSIWAASAISRGTDMKNWRKRNTAVAETIIGRISPG